MEKKSISAFFIIMVILVALSILTLANSESVAMLNPKGWIALKERDLMGMAIILMLIVVIPVFVLTFVIAWRYRASNKQAKYTPDWDDSWLAESVWWGLPCVIVLFLSILTWTSSHELDPYRPIEGEKKPLTIQVIALEWKWLFIYPEEKIATVNYFHIPEKTPISFDLSADAPMNSFWIPQLGGQIYTMGGMRSKLHLIADHEGTFRGSSANLSGRGFSGMVFDVIATKESDFDLWVKSVRESSKPLNLEEYKTLAKPSEYNPQASFVLEKPDLFEWIVMKPMMAEH